jgi:hypothetical protein
MLDDAQVHQRLATILRLDHALIQDRLELAHSSLYLLYAQLKQGIIKCPDSNPERQFIDVPLLQMREEASDVKKGGHLVYTGEADFGIADEDLHAHFQGPDSVLVERVQRMSNGQSRVPIPKAVNDRAFVVFANTDKPIYPGVASFSERVQQIRTRRKRNIFDSVGHFFTGAAGQSTAICKGSS